MRPISIFLMSTLLFLSDACQTAEQPKGILSKPQMVSVMMRIYLGESRITTLGTNPDSSYHLFLPYQDSLLRRRGVSDSTLKASYLYYLEHPKDLEEIYDSVIDSLSLMEQRARDPRKPG